MNYEEDQAARRMSLCAGFFAVLMALFLMGAGWVGLVLLEALRSANQ